MLDSVRLRLTIWYVVVLALMLLVFSASVYLLLARNLERRVDIGLSAALETMNHLLIAERAEGESVAKAAVSSTTELHFPNIAMAVFDLRGNLLSENTAPGNVHSRLTDQKAVPEEAPNYFTVSPRQTGDPAGWRTASRLVRATTTDEPYLIVVSQSLGSVAEDLASLRRMFYLAAPLALLLAGLGGWLLARKSLRPVVAMSERARRISADNLEQRLPVGNPRDELGQLAGTFNELLARLNAAFDQQRQFMADASHELRTPVHVIRTAAEVTLEKPQRADNEYRESLRIVDQQTRRLTRIVEDMFTLARADAGHRELERTDFYLDELLGETVRAAQVLAERKGVQIELKPARETPYRGDEGLLRQMLLNLLSNSIKFTSGGGHVSLKLVHEGDKQVITVEDSGSGIPLEAQPHVFERFFRADKARSRAEAIHNGSGAGLGLSIARWIAEAHVGTIRLERSDATGTTFKVELPEVATTSRESPQW